ncbi:hypothetical protein DIPPA_32269 [Diplonema papillatum]|nr:hypothetical protein DIPPA_32269 [Diplonema papillatum]
MVNGKVSSWNLAKGFGFVETEDGKSGFVHTSTIKGGTLKAGAAVSFDLEESDRKDKKLIATNVKGAGVVPKPKGKGKLTGTVKKWSVGNSLGFIEPEGTEDKKDVYVHASSFGGGNLEVGKKVNFDVEDVEHKSGRKIATNVSGEAVLGVGKKVGTVKKWIHPKGYGFVQPEGGSEDDEVYVHCSVLGGGYLLSGKQVFYDMGEKKDEKETRSLAVNVSGPAVRPPDSFAAMPMGRGAITGRGGGRGNSGGYGRGGRGQY